jgi:hypothetical protein
MNYVQENMFLGQLYNLRFQSRVVTIWWESVVRPRSVPQS